jgi:hypothetical protein
MKRFGTSSIFTLLPEKGRTTFLYKETLRNHIRISKRNVHTFRELRSWERYQEYGMFPEKVDGLLLLTFKKKLFNFNHSANSFDFLFNFVCFFF